MRVKCIMILLVLCYTFVYMEEEGRLRNLVPIPIVFSGPETGFGFGGMGVFYQKKIDDGKEIDDLNLRVGAIYTLKNQFIFFSGGEKYIFVDNYRIDFGVSFSDFASVFYGVGNDSKYKDEEKYKKDEINFSVGLNKKILNKVYTGPVIRVGTMKLKEKEEGKQLATGDILGKEDFSTLGLGWNINYAGAEGGMSPQTGTYINFESTVYRKDLGNEFEFWKNEFDYRNYNKLKYGVLAFQGKITLNSGDVPFQLMPTLGEEDVLRGVDTSRYMDKCFIGLQSEYRFPVYKKIYMGIFAGMAEVFPALDEIKSSNLHFAGGIGFRYMIDEKEGISMRVDYGINDFSKDEGEKGALHVNIGEAF